MTLAESDVANLPASLAARPLDVDVLHRTGNETASGTKDFTGDVILTGRQRAAAGFNYVNSLAGATLNNAITIGAASINVNDSGGDWLLDGSGNINGTPPVLPILGKFADNNELFAVLAVTGAGTASCTLTIRKGVGGTARAAHPVGTAIYPQVGQYEMLSANDRPARSVANMGMTNRFFLPPTSNIVSGLWTKAAAGQVCKIGFAMPDPAATVDIEVPIATTSSQVLATLKADANGTAGCEVWWDDTGWLWNITGSYGG